MFSTTDQIIECVPNFSEGRNHNIIKAIEASIANTPHVKLMHVDIGLDANRTVYTFAGKPDAVLDAAFYAIKTAAELIDMNTHKGEHPRIGACDVCPLIPIQNISMEEVVQLSKKLGERIGSIGIPVYLYEYSAQKSNRKNLTNIRKGEYEGLKKKLMINEWIPDYGPRAFNQQFGAMALGARKFLLAYNINLKSKDEHLAKEIAKQIRIIRDRKDNSYESNLFNHVKTIGWYMKEFQCTQISTNITDIEASPLIDVFTQIQKIARVYGIDTNGSELIGLLPLKALQHPKMTIDEAIEYLGLNAVKKFNKQERIIEYYLHIHP